MIRFSLLLLLCTLLAQAIDYNYMFFTGERFNPYNEESLEEFENKHNAALQPEEENLSMGDEIDPLAGAQLAFKGHLGLVWQYGYDTLGNHIMLSAEYALPNTFEEYPNFFVEADAALMYAPLRDSVDTGNTASYAYIGGFGGYGFAIDKRFSVKPRGGIAWIGPASNFIFAAATSAEYRFGGDEDIELVADLSYLMPNIFFFSLGVKYNYVEK